MATIRKTVFTNGEIYHVFNRGVDRKNIFNDKRDYKRVMETIKYYQRTGPKMKFSKYMKLSVEQRELELNKNNNHKVLVEILAYCLMPNHLHFLLRQISDNGISRFMSDISNSHSKYFNTKNERNGSLFQGPFKEVHIETEEQLIHTSRYIHLNPVASSIIESEDLCTYQWSSYPEYIGISENNICEKETILNFFKSSKEYEQFVLDQADYARQLDKIKHLTLE